MRRPDSTFKKGIPLWESGPLTRFLTFSCYRREPLDLRTRGVSLERITTAASEPRFWQEGGGFDRNVQTLEELRREIAYIHMNPVERGPVEKPEDWKWASARWHKGMRGQQCRWGAVVPIDRSRVDWGLQNP